MAWIKQRKWDWHVLLHIHEDSWKSAASLRLGHRLSYKRTSRQDQGSYCHQFCPVVVTGNFHLTVRRVERALTNQNCYLLVVQTKGINVWCASAGGEMNTHSIITALKTSDIASLVDHRELILPQLSAPGIDTKLLKKVRGWKGKWGPVYAGSLPEFLANSHTKTQKQSRVRFDLLFRMEMLFAMNFLLWLFFCGIALAIHPAWSAMVA